MDLASFMVFPSPPLGKKNPPISVYVKTDRNII